MRIQSFVVPIVAATALLVAPSQSSAQFHDHTIQHLQLKRGKPYSRARTTLLKQGWVPFRTKGDHGTAGDVLRAGWMEISFCSGTGRNFCTFIWKHHTQCALITTAGEFYPPEHDEPFVWDAEVDSCRAILKRA